MIGNKRGEKVTMVVGGIRMKTKIKKEGLIVNKKEYNLERKNFEKREREIKMVDERTENKD